MATDKAEFDVWARRVCKTRVLEADEELQLVMAAKNGCRKSTDKLVMHYQRLVIKVAYLFRHLPLPLLDLVQEGNIALILAISKYDETRGARFGSCAIFYVREAMRLYAIANLSIANTVSDRKMRAWLFGSAKMRECLTDEDVKSLSVFANGTVSFDQPLTSDDPIATLGDMIADDHDNVLELIEHGEKREAQKRVTRNMLRDLTTRQRDIVRRRVMVEDAEACHDIAKDYGISKQAVSLAYHKAMSHMRKKASRYDRRELL